MNDIKKRLIDLFFNIIGAGILYAISKLFISILNIINKIYSNASDGTIFFIFFICICLYPIIFTPIINRIKENKRPKNILCKYCASNNLRFVRINKNGNIDYFCKECLQVHEYSKKQL